MKRLRDEEDANLNSQIKRPLVSSRGESCEQTQIPGVGSGVGGGVAPHKLTAEDALSYLKAVKEMFQDQKEKYDMFLDVMKDFKSQRIDTSGVIARVKILFKGHNDLISGFNTFLPKGVEIKLVDEEESPPKKNVEFVEAISFVNKIKKRFQNDDRVYKSFLYTLNMYRQEHKDITEVNHEVEELFSEHPDLLEEFKRFLPDNSANASAAHVPPSRSSLPRDVEKEKHVDQQPQQGEMIAPKNEHEPSAERPDLDDTKATIKLHNNEDGNEKESGNRIIHNQDSKEPEQNIARDINNVPHIPEKRRSPRKIDASVDNKDALKSTFNQEFLFCDKVKERLQNPADYQAFLKCLNIYSTEVITRKELQSLVNDLLGRYPDLMDGFNEFLERCESIDGLLAGIMNRTSLPMEVEENNKSKEQKPKEKDRSKGKYSGKCIQELDLSECERCTPSYRLLPEDYPIPSVSQRTELGAQLLNDHWVSVTSGSEDYSFSHMRRNQYEESLFRCEDDRYELDMLLESARSTIKCIENLFNSIVDNSINPGSSICIEDYFTGKFSSQPKTSSPSLMHQHPVSWDQEFPRMLAQHLRCIERIYGDHGLEMMELLRRNPSPTLSVVLTRLKNKKEEWTKCLLDFNKVWAEIYAKNHSKALDHRSFYFKQQDSLNLSTKSLVAEIKGKEKIQKDETVHTSFRNPTSRNLKFEYSNTAIHGDLNELIDFSCKELCTTKDQLNRVKRVWTSLLEPMVGIVPHLLSSDGTENLNSGESTSKEHTDSCRVNFVNGVNAVRENGHLLEKDVKNTVVSDQARDAPTLRHCDDVAVNINEVPSAEHGEVLQSPPLVNGGLIANNGYYENYSNQSKIEKEEGELSPNGDFEEDSFVAFGANTQDARFENHKGNVNDSASNSTADQKASVKENVQKESRVFFGNDAFYVLFRLHQILYERLLSAKSSSTSAEVQSKKDTCSIDLYDRFMSSLYNLLDGTSDNTTFEYDCQDIIGNHSYTLFTLDKLIYKLVKKLQSVASDDMDNKLLQLYEYFNSRRPDKCVEAVYYEKVHALLHDENIYRFGCSFGPPCLSIQMMNEGNENADPVTTEPLFSGLFSR